MRRIFQAFCGLFAVGLLLTSCLNSDETEMTVYDDMAISTFTLGTLNRYLPAADGAVTKTTYAAGGYKMNIDQLGHTITNANPLLTGTDLAHVVCNVTTKNNGVVFVMPLDNDTPVYFNSGTDSIDFTQPRRFRVYATDESGYREYSVSLSVRTQEAGVFGWEAAEAADFPQASDTEVRQAAEAAGLTYIGRSSEEAYALNADGILMERTDDVDKWTEAALDTDAALLPQSHIAYTSWRLDDHTDYVLLAGQNPASDKAMVLWRKLADHKRRNQWVYMTLDEMNPYYLPKMDNIALVFYNGAALAFGSNGNIYVSRDQGITWKTTSTYHFPEGFNPEQQFEAVVGGDGSIWLKGQDDESEKVWKGRLTD